MSLQARFEGNVQKQQIGCWLWKGGLNGSGYGRLFSKDTGPLLAHRYSYTLHVGEIPDGLCVLHRCDMPACVNPEHLFLGTRADNCRDRHAKSRDARGEFLAIHMRRVNRRGDKNPSAKLTAAQVAEIRTTYAAGGITHALLAGFYGVARETITRALRADTWA